MTRKPTECDVQRVADWIMSARPEWRRYPVVEGLRHAISGTYHGTDNRDTFAALALALVGRPSINSPKNLKWPEQWRRAAEYLVADDA